MKNYITVSLLFFACILCSSCNTATPEKYFDVAVLNSNMLVGFASNGFLRQLDAPSSKLDPSTGNTLPVTRKELIGDRIKWLEEGYGKVKDLKETEETKEMLQSSAALYEYILPVYKKEYIELADLYDGNAASDKVEAKAKEINEKYFAGFNSLYDKLINIGKGYAAKHNIKVNWGS